MVLLHGFLGEPQEWQKVAAQLSEHFYCLAPALPGHAGSPAQAHDFAELADELWEQIEAQLPEPEQFALFGYSLGGRLAMELTRKHFLRIGALILEGAHPGLQETEQRRQRREHDEAWALAFEKQPWHQSLDAWYRQPVFASLDEHQRADLIARRAQHNPDHLAAVLRSASLAGQPDMRGMLNSLSVPVMFIAGTKDDKFSAIGDELAAMNPELCLAKLPDIGHNCHAEAPEQVADLIVRSLPWG